MLACTIAQNILISLKSDKIYPYLREKDVKKLSKPDVDEIKKNTFALMFHKIGAQVVNSTDNILVSKIIGIAIVGIYSNYLLVTTALNTIVAQLFSAITASVGNLGASVEKEQAEIVMKRIFFGNFWFIAVVCSAFYSSIELLIKVMFGEHMVLDQGVLICIVSNLYLYNIRRTAWTFRDAYGLFWYDRYKALAEAGINLVISIVLGIHMGLVGILIGTVASTVFTSLWVEPYILYKYVFKKKPTQYFWILFRYTLITAVSCYVCKLLVNLISIQGYLGFIIGVIISAIICSLIIMILYFKSSELGYYKDLMLKLVKKILQKK